MSLPIQAEKTVASDLVDEKSAAPISEYAPNSEIEVSLSAQVESYVLKMSLPRA